MLRLFGTRPPQLVLAGALALAAPLALAHGGPNVNWSLSIGTPGPVYVQPAPVYVQPVPTYVQPAPVYVQPRPVYVRPAPVFGYGPPVYVERRGPRWHHHHWHGHDYDHGRH